MKIIRYFGHKIRKGTRTWDCCCGNQGSGDDSLKQHINTILENKMVHTERDKRLTEAMGECIHPKIILKKSVNASRRDWDRYVCSKCFKEIDAEDTPFDDNDKPYFDLENDFSTGNGFIKLWEFCQKQEWWYDFLNKDQCFGFAISVSLIHPDRFSDAVYSYLKEKEKEDMQIALDNYYKTGI